MIGSSFCKGVGHIEGRPSMIGLGGVRLSRMGLKGGVRLATIENYDERKRNVAQLRAAGVNLERVIWRS